VVIGLGAVVEVIAGDYKGATGAVFARVRKKNGGFAVLVNGVGVRTCAGKRDRSGRRGAPMRVTRAIDVSNVKLLKPAPAWSGKAKDTVLEG
jgi:ribosomal protein L24